MQNALDLFTEKQQQINIVQPETLGVALREPSRMTITYLCDFAKSLKPCKPWFFISKLEIISTSSDIESV